VSILSDEAADLNVVAALLIHMLSFERDLGWFFFVVQEGVVPLKACCSGEPPLPKMEASLGTARGLNGGAAWLNRMVSFGLDEVGPFEKVNTD